MKRQLTAEQQAARDERRARFGQLVKQVADMTDEQRQQFSDRMMVTTVEGHTLSLTNQMLAVMQCQSPTIVGGFNQWKAQGRHVRKGEHGMMIWAPTVKRDEKASTPDPDDLHFITVTVFDISQTEPDEVTA